MANVPYPWRLEQTHAMLIGNTGSGKTTQLKNVVAEARERGQRCVVFDLTGAFVEAFYRPETDHILNPMDTRCPPWAIFNDCRNYADFLSAATALIPSDGGNREPFWAMAARTLFVEMCVKLALNRALLTLRMDLAVNALMGMPRTRELRMWYLFDEVHALHRLPAIEHGLQTARGVWRVGEVGWETHLCSGGRCLPCGMGSSSRSSSRWGLFCGQFASAQQDVSAAPAVVWPYTIFGGPGEVVSTRNDARLGTTTVTFATGARLVVKPTRFSPGQVAVITSFGNGRSGVPDKLVHALWATTLFPIGGTGKLSYAEIDQWQRTSGHTVNITLVPTASAFELTGEVPSSDLSAEMQLLTAYARDPGFRQEAADKISIVGPMIADQIEGDPASTFMRGVQHTLVARTIRNCPKFLDQPRDPTRCHRRGHFC